MRLIAIATLLLLGPSLSLGAQREPEREVRRGGAAFAIEAMGGVGGSLAGVGAGLLISGAATNECDVEDLVCGLKQAATTGVVSVVGATAGTYIAGRAANTEPSFVGSLLGAIAGAAAGVGVMHLLNEETKIARNNATLAVAYSVTQGVVAALGSRLIAAVR
jgi:uncharacterized membrane protein YfcA